MRKEREGKKDILKKKRRGKSISGRRFSLTRERIPQAVGEAINDQRKGRRGGA